VKIDEKKLFPILLNNPFIKTFVVEGCEDITDESLRIIAKHCNLTHLSIRESKVIEGSPIWEMSHLTTLVLVECSKIRSKEAMAGLSKMRYLTYLNLCNRALMQTATSGSMTTSSNKSPTTNTFTPSMRAERPSLMQLWTIWHA
jgi:hypothetical protein